MKNIIIDCNSQNILKNQTNNNLFKVLHAPINISAGMQNNLYVLKNNNIFARGINIFTNNFKYDSDFIVDISIFKSLKDSQKAYRKLFEYFLDKYDIFHFYFGQTFLNNYEDLKILKENKKGLVMSYMGSDCRLPSEVIKYNKYYKKIYQQLGIDEDKIHKNLEKCSEYVDYVISGPSNAYLSLSKYFKYIYINRTAINIKHYKVNNVYNKIPIIVHAPTNRLVKGSEYIFSAIKNLKKKYKFEFKCVEKLPFNQAMEIYKNADIIIDQLNIGEYGMFAIECMAMGKPVICYHNEYFMKLSNLGDTPVINANPDNIEKVIENYLNNRDLLIKTGINARHFVEKYHDLDKYGQNLIQIYQNTLSGEII